jgi:uncharacterized repeat protein (TIGR01451 family)
VTNAGPSMATGVRLEDVLPPTVKFVLVETSQGSGTNDNGTVRCELGNLATGSNAAVRIIVEATALGFLTNAATATGTDSDPVATNNTLSVVSQVRLGADLALSASVAPALALMEQQLTYTLAVSNRGPNEATGVRVEDLLPPDVSVVLVRGAAFETNAGRTVWLELGELDSGAMAVVTLVIVPHQSNTITNRASVTSDAVDADTDNNAVTLVTTIQPWADYVLTQNASFPLALVNAPLTFAIRVTPLVPYAVPQTSLTDSLPDSVDFVSATTSHGVCRTESENLICDLGVVPGGETATVLLTVVPRALGEMTNQVVLASPFADPARSNLTSRLAVMVVDTPTLQFERSQNRLLLWWPLVAQDFILEVTDNLLPPVSWAQERNSSVVVGDRVTTTIKMSTTARYYRLRKS